MKALLSDPAAVLSSIAGSTAAVDYPGIVDFVGACLASRPSTDYPAHVATGITRAAGAIPVEVRGAAVAVQRRIELRGPAFYLLRRVPDIKTIRTVLNQASVSRAKRSK